MNGLDLDELRGRWAEQGQRIDESLVLDAAAVRAALQGRTVSAFRRHGHWLLAGLAGAVAVIAWLGVFIATHALAGEWTWMCLGISLLPLTVSEAVVDLREWRALRRLEFDAPVLDLREALDALQATRLRQVKAILACSVLLWMPLLLVLVKSLGGDLMRVLHPSVLWVNVAVGLAFIPLSLGVAAWVSRRYRGRPGLRRFGTDAAGDSWRRARGQLELLEDFEGALERDPAAAVGEQAWPPALVQEVRALRRRLLVGILGCAAAMVAVGLFNMAHGGQVQFIVPGVLLNLAVVAQMASAIQLRVALVAGEDGVRALRERLGTMLALRRRFAVGGVVALPLVALALLQVAGQVLFSLDVSNWLGGVPVFLAICVAVAACIVLWRQARRDGAGFTPRLVDALSLGVLGTAAGLQSSLEGKQGP